jgi:hypothetical protein
LEIEQELKLGVALYWKVREKESKDTLEWFKFKKSQEFWDFVISKVHRKERLIVMSHNLPFDVRVVKGFKYLKEKGFELNKLIVNNYVNIWKFRKETSTILFLDSLNYFNLSLARLGESIGIKKLEMPRESESDKKWFVYCQRDVEVIYQALKLWFKFLKDNDLGCFSLTLAGQSFNAFRHRFMREPIYIHDNGTATALERESYHGGRNECFFIGKLPEADYYHLDVNSMYPYVMQLYDYPRNLKSLQPVGSIPFLRYMIKKFAIVARVKLRAYEPAFPLKIGEKLCFPTGIFDTVLTTRELEYALDRNYIKEVFEMAIYDKAPLFKEFVNFFYKKRLKYKEDKNSAFDFMCKLLMNSLYGKWGQKNEVFKVIERNTKWDDCYIKEYNLDEREWQVFRVINGVVEQKVGEEEAYHSFPAISAHITADARMLLWWYIREAGEDNVFYCDTDSIFVNQAGFDKIKDLLHPFQLGKIKIADQSRNVEIRGLKDYTFGDKTRIKGIRNDAIKIGFDEFSQWHFEGMRGSIHHHRTDKMVMSKVVKKLRRDYQKGEVQENGKVKPLHFNEICPSEIF